VDVHVDGGRFLAAANRAGARIDATGRFLVPSFIDAHVHLAYLPQGPALARAGVAGAVDWAAPTDAIRPDPQGPQVVWSGPMIAAPGGYPTRSWGRDGYGIECASRDEAVQAVQRVYDLGARVVKLSLGAGPDLDDATLRAVVDKAHGLGIKVGVHALSDADANRAAGLGIDVLVHAPRGELSAETARAWRGRAVIATLSAFGGVVATRQLRAEGATVLYGTDFGNTSVIGISEREIRGLLDAGLDGPAIVAAGTAAPAAWFGLTELGAIEPGNEASFLVLDRDPHADPLALARPVGVVFRGELVQGTW
jgi:imidazolonepropionase-like amidohydrolase